MAENYVATLQKVNHCKLIWLIQNVYQCRTLRKACIDGPDYGTKCATPFPWALKLGQSTNDEQKGISLYINGVNLTKDIPVKFRVYVVKQTSVKPLLDEKYQAIFGSETVWESPLLATNDDFQSEPLKEISCDFWEIHVELMWNEIVERLSANPRKPQTSVKNYTYDALSKLLCFKEIGTDLKQFYKNARFSDTYIRCGTQEIPAHKAILEARCPYFAEKINSYSGDCEESIIGLSPTKDQDVMKAFLMYLYTGDIESLMADGPLPVGIHKCAQQMRKYDLEWLTSPLQLYGYSHVLSELYGHFWNISDRFPMYQHRDFKAERSGNAVDNKILLTTTVKFCKSKDSVDCISVFLQLDELAKGDGVYVVFEVSINLSEKEKISKRTAGDLTLKGSIGFPEFAHVDDFSKTAGVSGLFLHSSITVFEGNLSTRIEKMSINCSIKPEERSEAVSPVSELGDGCHGWINLSSDLGQLLMTENYSDCTIVVGEVQFPAHRVVLSARSRYFSTIFNEKEEECIGSSKGMKILVEKDIKISPQMMKIILEEIYTGSSNIKDSQAAKNIYNFSKFFGLKGLEMKCQSYSEMS